METLGASYPSFWMHEQHRSFSAGLASERMHFGSVVAELPPPASSAFRVRDAGEENVGNLPPARKLQKAGRERLRRDHLNEQFAKLADVLDPVRPKLDKGTILAESILAVNKLRSDIARMKNERIALSAESRDLGQEKAELQEEKAALETEVGRLQEQRSRSSHNNQAVDWRIEQAVSFPLVPPSKEVSQDPSSPFLSTSPYSAFLHPAYQPFGMFRAHFPQIHVERPAPRYPVPIHPTPVYPAKTMVATDLQLQTPGLPTTQLEKSPTKVGQGPDSAIAADELITPQLSLSASFIKS